LRDGRGGGGMRRGRGVLEDGRGGGGMRRRWRSVLGDGMGKMAQGRETTREVVQETVVSREPSRDGALETVRVRRRGQGEGKFTYL